MYRVSQLIGCRIDAKTLAGIAAAAIAVKVILLFFVVPYLHNASPTTYQAERFPDWYDMIATNIADGHGYKFYPDTTSTMLRTPGWILVLAGIFKLFGPDIVIVKIFNVLCSVGTASLVFVLGRRVIKSDVLALLAAAVFFFHPATLIAESRGGAESIFTLALTVFMFLTYRALETSMLRDYAKAGAALGIVLLIKSTPALFPPLLFFYMVGLKPTLVRMRDALVRIGIMLFVAGVVLSPWVIRNYALSKQIVPTMSVGGMAGYIGLYIATHSDTGREQYVLDFEATEEMNRIAEQMGLQFKPGYYPQFYNIADETRFYSHLGDIVKQTYVEHPDVLMKALIYNGRGFWIQGRTVKATQQNTLLVLPILALAILGGYLGWRQSLKFVVPMLIFIVAYYAAHLAIEGQARYQVPIIPLLAILIVIPFGLLSSAAPNRLRKQTASA